VIRGVNPKAPTPAWMRHRLERFGQRSISALVDISNYVMLELGRPSHIFDLDKVQGKLNVRWGLAGETVELLNGQTVPVDPQVGVIADDLQVEALAGVMGGEATAVSDATENVFVEAAFWWPDAIAGRARRYGFATDAAHRFERGTDFASTAKHVEYITQLVLDICGGHPGPVVDQVLRLPERTAVTVNPDRVRRLIGKAIEDSEMGATFARLACTVTRAANGDFMVTPPSYRFDLTIEEDFVEEVARIHGFDNIPATLTRATTVIIPQSEGARTRRDLRRHMVGSGFQEVINYAFVDREWETDLMGNPDPVRLANPIASHMSVMRSSLLGGLIATLRSNLNRGAGRLNVFEIGRCFLSDSVQMDQQPERVAALAYGPRFPEQWGEEDQAIDFFAMKGVLEGLVGSSAVVTFRAAQHAALHPGRAADVIVQGEIVGCIGELHPKWQQRYELPQAPLVFEIDTNPLLVTLSPRYSESSRMQAIRRDVAVLVDDSLSVGDIVDTVKAAAPELVKRFELFDIYRGAQVPAGKKSLAFLILMQHNSRTLTDSDADSTAAEITQILTQKFAATIRA
jgi:phenylalanyl-tRNA synthetase beta chain